MAKRIMNKRETQIGDYWLSRRPGRPTFFRTWFDPETRQTRRASLGTADKAEAQLIMAKWVAAHGTMRELPLDQVKLVDILERYWQAVGRHLVSSRAQAVSYRYWKDFYGDASIADLTIDRQEAFVASLKGRELSSSYIKKVVGFGRWALNRARERHEIAEPPRIIKIREARPAMRRLEPDEVARLIEASRRRPHVYMFVMLALNTLSRPGALLELHLEQCDFERGLIYLNQAGRSQTKKRRPVVPMTETLRRILELAPSGRLVQFADRPVKQINRAFAGAVKRAELPRDVVPMTMRRTMARELRRRGVGSWDVAGLMGHRLDERTTEIYAEYDAGYQKQAVEAIDAFMNEVAK